MLDGPEISPKNGNKPKQLILLLHGVGSDGNNLLDIAKMLSLKFPDAHFIAPNAPFPYDMVPVPNNISYNMSPVGYQWFSLTNTSEQALLKGLNNAMPYLNKFVDYQLKRFGLTEENLAVIGFSQGTMLSLHTFPRRSKAIALIVGLSGTLIAPQLLEKELKSKPSILFMYGEKDQVLPVKYMKLASQSLKNLGFDIKTRTYQDLEHSIIQEEIDEVIKALKEKFHSLLNTKQSK